MAGSDRFKPVVQKTLPDTGGTLSALQVRKGVAGEEIGATQANPSKHVQTEANRYKPKQHQTNRRKPKQAHANSSKPKQTKANRCKPMQIQSNQNKTNANQCKFKYIQQA